ncbi:4a-hydroxytetrahydrobiopterin dehydratase [bacterium]|nr:4a-hydroxytetrahydrobiopterin dehydratase [bacterium]
MDAPLSARRCSACRGDTPVLSEAAARELAAQTPGWELESNLRLRRQYRFKTFAAAWAWVDRVAALAESEGHHPDLSWSYNRVTVELSTHAVGGLSENDFILAAKIDALE